MIVFRDLDIRRPLHYWLQSSHKRCDDIKIIHELKMPRPSARIDIAVINGELCGFEIKSDIDSLYRLARQQNAFSCVFDRVTIVTTRRHMESATRIVPDWWGVILAEGISSNPVLLSEREARLNPQPSPVSTIHLLSRLELSELLASMDLSRGRRGMRREILAETLLERLPPETIRMEVRRILKLRANSHTSSS